MLDLQKETALLLEQVELLRLMTYVVVSDSKERAIAYENLADNIKKVRTEADKISRQSGHCLMALKQNYERKNESGQ